MNMRVSGNSLNDLSVRPSLGSGSKGSLSAPSMEVLAMLLMAASAMSDSALSEMSDPDEASGVGGTDGEGQGEAGSPSFQKLGNWKPGQQDGKTGESTVQGDPPADLAPPPGTTAGDLYNKNPEVFDSINKMKWKGEKEGDTFAKNNGFKSFDDMKNSNSPEAAKAMAKLQWVGTAANNAKIDDSKGSHARSADLQGGGLTGIRGSGEVDPHSTAAIAQDYIVHGQSMNGKTTKATDRVNADGTCKSNAQIVGKKIGDAIGKVIPWVKLVTNASLDKEAEDHANSVDDKITAKEAHQKIGKDFKDFAKEEAELAASAIPGVGPELAIATKGAEMGAELGASAARAGQAARGAEGAGNAGRGAEGAGNAGRGAEGAEGAGNAGRAGRGAEDPASAQQWQKAFQTILSKLREMNGATPPLTMKQMTMNVIKHQFKEALKDEVKQQLEQALHQELGGSDSPQSGSVPGLLPFQAMDVQKPTVAAAG